MRLFVALDLPSDVRGEVRELIERLAEESPKIRWVRPEGIHVTLKFIGHVDADRASEIRSALKSVHSTQAIEMHFTGMGFFPNERRPRVVWCGVQATPNLTMLVAAIEKALEPLGIEPESRPFVPHLTLARIDTKKIDPKANDSKRIAPGDIQKLARAAKAFTAKSFGSARETEFHLYESLLKPSGAEYKRVESFPLLKGTA